MPTIEEKILGRYDRYGPPIAFALISISVYLIYSSTLSYPFLFDDQAYVQENSQIRDLARFWPPSGTRFMGYLSFALNYRFNGLGTEAFRLTNISIHAVNAGLVFIFVKLLFRTPLSERFNERARTGFYTALAASLLFAVHPIQTQAVTYICQRFTSLAALFYLSSLALFLKYRLGPGPRLLYYVLAVLTAVAAQKTKEISFTLPFAIALCEFSFFRSDEPASKRLSRLLPFFLTLLIIPLSIFGDRLGIFDNARYIGSSLKEAQLNDLTTLSPYHYLLTQFRVIVTYVRLLVLPINQSLEYDFQLFKTMLDPRVILSFIFVATVFTGAVYGLVNARKKASLGLAAFFGAVFFFLALSVESSIIPIEDVIFEHRLYLPSVGAALAFSTILVSASEAAHRRFSVNIHTLAIVLILAFTAPLGIAAYKRNFVWQAPITLYRDAVDKAPGNARAHYNLGIGYKEAGLNEYAIKEYEASIRLKPDAAHVHNNLGNAFKRAGRMEEAMAEYESALKLNPALTEANYNLAQAYYSTGRTEEAVALFRQFIAIAPPSKYANHIERALEIIESQDNR